MLLRCFPIFLLLLLIPDLFFSHRFQERFVPAAQENMLQITSKPDSFISPLDIPLTLAGNFGEPRKSHFHTGLDFRTNQMEGLKVYAVADGYVSRINVSGGGYGNALYITHPSGYTTVYAHLREFSDKIQKRLRTEQYSKESFAVDFNLPPNEIVVKQGDVIALSGNTGGSGGPHLHFEVRDANEWPHNPMLYGYNLKDNIKPVIGFLKLYPLEELKYKAEGYRTKPLLQNGIYEVATGTIKVNDNVVGFSVNSYDLINNTSNTIGIYNMTVFDDDKMVYDYRIDKLSFADKRYVLSHVDYPVFIAEGRKSFHKCFQEPGNKCPVYSNVVNGGSIDVSDGKPHKILVEITDFAGNVSLLDFKLQYEKSSTLFKQKNFNYTTLFNFNRENKFETKDIKVNIPAGCLFDDVYFNYIVSETKDSSTFSKVHQLGRSSDLSFDWFDVSVRAEKLPTELSNKALLVLREDDGAASAKGGVFANGFVTARTRDFGTYCIKVDTTAPKIQALNVVAGKNMRVYKKLLFKISDNLSGISDFDTYIDGKWTVTEYDQKTATLTHWLDLSLPSGEHTFKVVVEDERKNRRELSLKFFM
jgi:hypothetical protein